ncbi:MAG TPA: acetylornithine deacetylase [Stellaceae bacterium]|nr:acetylornithine deacetylase [Stellaceae bacterium]
MVTRLVGFDTTSRNSNLALIEFVRDYLDSNKVTSELVFAEDRNKANLYATIGPQDRGGIMLSGHTDVVPVDDQDWRSDPFKIVEQEGRLYGRGSADMKSFIAVVLTLVPELVRRKLRTPIHLSFSYDEEVGCIGVRRLISVLGQRPNRPRLAIVGEPTSMQIGVAHKGKHVYRCHVHGHEAHSSQVNYGVNAVEAAAELVTHLKAMARRKRDEGPFDPDFDPSYTSIHTGLIHGGTALNIVPKDCEFDFEFRPLPGEDVDALIGELRDLAATKLVPEMRAVQPHTGINIDDVSAAPALSTPVDAEVTQLVAALTGENATTKVAFGTEGGLFSAAGIPTVICGPGSIDQAHKPDEYVELDQIARCEAFLKRLIDRVSQR